MLRLAVVRSRRLLLHPVKAELAIWLNFHDVYADDAMLLTGFSLEIEKKPS